MTQPSRDEPTTNEAPLASDASGSAEIPDLLDRVQTPVESASFMSTSGRRYELRADEGRDELTVRGNGGEIVLRIEVTDQGPVLSFSGATLDLVATRRMRLEAEELTLQSKRDMVLESGGSLHERIGGVHHTRVAGDERLEARAVEVQASEGAVGIRAMRKIALDGEHIGLNDDPLPQPFPWSGIGEKA